MKQARLIWNPAAGRMNIAGKMREVAQVLETSGWQVEMAPSQSAAHVTQLARETALAGWEAVFVAGGDGTLGRAVAGLAGSGTALGVLPSGTTNVWAQEIGLPLLGLNPLAESARRLAQGTIRVIDLGMCNNTPFFLWAGFGLDARVIDQLERKRNRWMKQINELYYAWTILRSSAGWAGIPIRVTADGQTFEEQVMLALAGNIRLYAGGLVTLSPQGAWDDGLLELWLLRSGKKGGVGSVIRHLWNLRRGKHVQDRKVVYLPFKQAHLTFENEEWMQTDGEPGGMVREVDIKVWEKGLRVLVPQT